MENQDYKELVGTHNEETDCLERLKLKNKARKSDSFNEDDFNDRRIKYGNYQEKVILHAAYLKDYLSLKENHPEELEERMTIRHEMKLIKTSASQTKEYDENDFTKIYKGLDVKYLKEMFDSTEDSIERNKFKCLARNAKGYNEKDFPNKTKTKEAKLEKYQGFVKDFSASIDGMVRLRLKTKAKRSKFFKESDFIKRPTRVAAAQ